MNDRQREWDLIVKRATMQVSPKFRRGEGRFFHWCPGCDQMHQLPDNWKFNGNLDKPTFTPSFMHGRGTPTQCHYILTDGVLNFCNDSHHPLKGKSIPLPELPDFLRD